MYGNDSARVDGGVPSSAALAVAIDNVRLVYHYLDHRDFGGYLSFLRKDIRIFLPGQNPACGVRAVEEVQRSLQAGNRAHILYQVLGSDSTVVARGVLDTGSTWDEFVDIFTVDEYGMLMEHRRFLGDQPGTR